MVKATTRKRDLARPPVQARLSKKRVAEALRLCAGIQLLAAEKLRVSRPTLCRYLKKHPDLKAVIDETQDELTDLGEGKLIDAMRKGEGWAIKYFLDNFGQRRGYGIRKLAFKDGDGQMIVPAFLVTNGRLTQEEWDARYGHLGEAGEREPPVDLADDIPPEQLN